MGNSSLRSRALPWTGSARPSQLSPLMPTFWFERNLENITKLFIIIPQNLTIYCQHSEFRMNTSSFDIALKKTQENSYQSAVCVMSTFEQATRDRLFTVTHSADCFKMMMRRKRAISSSVQGCARQKLIWTKYLLFISGWFSDFRFYAFSVPKLFLTS